MAQRTNVGPTELPRPSLTVTKADAESKLNKRIDLGKEIINRSIDSQQSLDEAIAERKKWHDYNKDLLGVIFDNENYAQEYQRNSHGSMIIMGHRSLSEKIRGHLETLQRRIDALSSIIERLELLPTQIGQKPQDNEDLSPKSIRKQGHYTLNISGGTVMVGDGNQTNNVTVGDIIMELEREVNNLPDSSNKQKALDGLNALTKNETFANITGAALGSFLSNLLK